VKEGEMERGVRDEEGYGEEGFYTSVPSPINNKKIQPKENQYQQPNNINTRGCIREVIEKES
jgi:hypothetical protein